MTHSVHCSGSRGPLAVLATVAVFALSQAAGADQENPLRFPPEFKSRPARIVPVSPPEGSSRAWQTGHFTILSDQDIRGVPLQGFATTVESVPDLLERHPLSLWSPHGGSRPLIRLCRDAEHFASAGGPDGSAGYFNGRRNEVLIRADLFLTPQGESTRLKAPPNETLLVHELVHLATAGIMAGSPPWLNEGLAEYFSVAHQRGGHYRFDRFTTSIPKHVHRHLARQPTDTIVLPSLESVTGMRHNEWNASIRESAIEDRYLPYATALLIVHYHLEGGAARRAEFAAHLDRLRTRSRGRRPPPGFRIEDSTEVESRISGYWATRGLKLRFGNP